MTNDCIFCKIISGEIPSAKIYEDEHTFSFLDISPNNIGHSLVLPKKHAENIHDITEEDLAHVMRTVKKMSAAIKKGVEADGINIIMNNGKYAGQVIFHSHTHIIPRFKKDGLQHWQGKHHYKDGEMKDLAEKIQKEIL